jgi:hypothetical protein
MTHGIAGTSKNATSKRTSPSAQRRRTASRATRRANTEARNGGAATIDRDALLRTIFPGGIPPRQDVVGAVNAWLDEAERLARTR